MAIATIDDSLLQTKKNQLAGNIHNSQLQNAQIDAQIVFLNNERDLELSLMNHNIASAQANLQSNKREYQRQVITQTEVQEALAVLELAKTQHSCLRTTSSYRLSSEKSVNANFCLPLS